MPTVAEALNSKHPLGAALEQGVRTLSMDQKLTFSLYQRYVFPLDGMNYWIKIPSNVLNVTTPGIQTMPGLASQTPEENESVQVCPGGIGAINIVGGTIYNPLTIADQGLSGVVVSAEPLYVDFTAQAYGYETATTSELLPGESIDIPANPTNGAWVTAPSEAHQFTVVIQKSVPSVTLPTDVEVMGSFHYASSIEQNEDAVVDINDLLFTSLSEIQPFNQIGPNHLYIAHYQKLIIAFSSRARLYEQADLYHYQGKALRSKNATQIIDDINNFNPQLVVSNSLPIWLNMPNYVPPYPTFRCPIPLYPSFLVDDNLPPPFGSVHVAETVSLQMRAYLGPRMQAAELCRDHVIVHLYGCNNAVASDFLEFVTQYSYDWMTLGFANSPAIVERKSPQPEFKILSQYKTIDFRVNYLEQDARNIARQLIEHAKVQNQWNWIVGDP